MDENEWPISILSTYEEMHLDFFLIYVPLTFSEEAGVIEKIKSILNYYY